MVETFMDPVDRKTLKHYVKMLVVIVHGSDRFFKRNIDPGSSVDHVDLEPVAGERVVG